jgi:hypothetical protein
MLITHKTQSLSYLKDMNLSEVVEILADSKTWVVLYMLGVKSYEDENSAELSEFHNLRLLDSFGDFIGTAKQKRVLELAKIEARNKIREELSSFLACNFNDHKAQLTLVMAALANIELM